MNQQKIRAYLDGRRRPRGLKRDIVDETLIWTPSGYSIYEVLSCGHIQPLQADDDGMPNANYRMCKACLKDRRIPHLKEPDFNVFDLRKMNWYEEKIATYQASTMHPYAGYDFSEGPEGSRLSQMRAVYELLHHC